MKKQLLNFRTLVLAAGMLLSGTVSATFTAVTSGNWSSAATWGGTAPSNTVTLDDIVIPSGITVTLDADVTFSAALNTFSVGGTLSNANTNQLTITQGVLAGTGMISIRRLVLTNLATATFAGTMNLNEFVNSSLAIGFVGMANIADSLILESGSLLLNTNSNLTMLSNSTVRINNGTLGISGGIFTSSNNYNVMYVGTSKTAGVELNSSTIQTIAVQLSNNSQTLKINTNTTVNNNLNLMMGKVDLNGKKLILNGDLNMTAGTAFISNATSELQVLGTGTLSSGLVFDAGAVMNNLTINRPTTVKLMSPLAISGNLYLMSGSQSLEAGSSLSMNSGAVIHVVGGTLTVNSGNFVGTSPYDVEYAGATNANAGIELSGSGLNNVSVNYTTSTSQVALTNSIAIGGKLNMMNGQLNLNAQNLWLNGTLSQNASASFVGNPNSQLYLNLSSAANTTLFVDNSTAANNTLSRLKLNIAGSSTLMLGSQLTLRDELAFVSGKLMIDNNDLILQSTASISGFDDTHYVITTGVGNGRLQMNVTAGGSFVTFPIGTFSNYSPAYVQQTSAATSGNVMIKAMDDVLTAGYVGLSSAATSALVKRTWFVEAEPTVTVNMNLKLGWVAAAEVNAFNRTNAMIRHYVNGSWDSYTTGSASAGANNTFELTRSGLTSLSPFAVADANAPLSIKNVTGVLGFEMYPNPAKDMLILELANTTHGYKYELCDITGKSVKDGTVSKSSSVLDIASMKPGYYFIKLTNLDDNVSGVKRFIKD